MKLNFVGFTKYMILGIATLMTLLPSTTIKAEGEIPIPFASLNQKVELANEEFYTLVGTVVFEHMNARVLFAVDLEIHPWLANVTRRANPHYPLLGEISYWRPFIGRKIQVVVQAQVVNEEILLKSLADPKPYSPEDI